MDIKPIIMNIKKEDIATFREQYELAKLANVEEFIFKDEPILMEYAHGVLKYFDILKSAGMSDDWIEKMLANSQTLEFVRNTPVQALIFAVVPIFEKERVILSTNTPQGLFPIYMVVDQDILDEIKKNT